MERVPSGPFVVGPPEAGRTLEAALRGWLAGASWGEVRRLIRSRKVAVNGSVALDGRRRLAENEVVRIVTRAAPTPPKDADVRIVYQDAHVVVMEKPSGMLVMRHPEERHWPESRKRALPALQEAVTRILGGTQAARHLRRPPLRVRPVHRLDWGTSGLIVMARTPAAEQKLIQQFAAHTVHRVYQAIVSGQPQAQRIASHIARDRGDGLRGSTSDEAEGKRAVTHIRPLQHRGGFTLLECRLETGRTHQIRIHLAELGCPVCGDTKYGPEIDVSGAPRLALHAAELGFVHPASGKELRFETPLPADLKKFLSRLQADAGKQ